MGRFLVLGLWLLIAAGCISFSTTLPDDPEGMIDYMVICKSVDREADFEKEIRSESIQRTDPIIYALIKVNNISRPLTLRWKWYDPKKKLAKTSKDLEVNKAGKYLEFFSAWDTLSAEHYRERPGRWTVAVYVGERFLYRSEFEIR